MVTKKVKAAAAEPAFAPGDVVIFKGYEDDVPEAERLLVAGQQYTLSEINEDGESVAVEIPNPDFNAKKKESEDNSKVLIVDVFFDEVELAPEEEPEPATKPAARGRAKAAPAPAAVADDEEADDEEGDEEEAAPAPSRGRAKATAAKPAAKPAVKTTAKAPAKTTAAKAATKVPAKGKGKLAAKATAPVEEDKYPALAEEDADMLAIIDGADDLLELANELCDDAEALNYKLGGVLYHLRLNKAYVAIDKKYAEQGGWQKCIEEQLPGVGYRKAMNLIDIYYMFNLHGIDPAKVQELGWTKCSRIASVMTEDNAEELLTLAEENSVSDLNDNIRESYSKTATEGSGTEKRKKILFKFGLWQDQAEAVKEILESTASRLGLKKLDDAFEHIIVEWAAEHAPAQKPPVRKAGNATRPKAVARA